MKEPRIILFAGDRGWRLARGESVVAVSSSDGGNPNQIGESIAEIIGQSQAPVTLALPSSWCLAGTISLAGVQARNRRTALLYRLELMLPIAAEDVAADYIFNEPASALAICTPVQTVKPLLDALGMAGVSVHSIIPASVYAAAWLLGPGSLGLCDLLIWQASDSLEIFAVRSGRIAGWYLVPPTAVDLIWHLDQTSSTGGALSKIIACNLQLELLACLKLRGSEVIVSEQKNIDAIVAAGMSADFQSPVELRRDGLAPSDGLQTIRKPIKEILVAGFLMMACVCAGAFWRSARLEQLADSDRLQQQKLFHEAFPGRAIPPNIVSRLRSEQRSLKNDGGDSAKGLVAESALPTLQFILAGINAVGSDVRLEVDDLKVGDRQFSLDGIVRNRSDLTGLVDSLEQTTKLKLDPPQTEQMGGKGLHITLSGSRITGTIGK